MRIVDAHEDIAWSVFAAGRDVCRSALETRRLEEGTGVPEQKGLCMLGLPEWLAGGVAVICGTIFASPARGNLSDANTYTNAEEAHSLGLAQLDIYRRLADECEQIALVGTRADLDVTLVSWETETPQVGIIPLMEGADPIP